MHILIVDDEPLARQELHYLVTRHPAVTSVAEADSVDDAVKQIMDKKPQIVFLDIHLTDESGFELAEKLQELTTPPYLIFATAYDEYALKAFDVNASDYVLKPFEESRIYQAVQRAEDTLKKEAETKKEAPAMIPITSDDRIYLLDPREIFLVSVDERTLTIFTDKQTYQTNGTLHWLEEQLPSDLFFKPHRSYLLNLSKIREIQSWFNNTLMVTLTNGEKVPVSRSYVKQFKEKVGLQKE